MAVSNGFFLSASEKKTDELLDRLILDIKAFVLLQGAEGTVRARIQDRLVGSHDEEVRHFVESVQTGRRPRIGQLVVIGIGELVVASLLVVAGTIALVPTMVGISTPQQLLGYFCSQVLPALANSPLSQYASALEFLVGAFLLLAAFYTLRQAALSLKEMGLSVKTSED